MGGSSIHQQRAAVCRELCGVCVYVCVCLFACVLLLLLPCPAYLYWRLPACLSVCLSHSGSSRQEGLAVFDYVYGVFASV